MTDISSDFEKKKRNNNKVEQLLRRYGGDNIQDKMTLWHVER